MLKMQAIVNEMTVRAAAAVLLAMLCHLAGHPPAIVRLGPAALPTGF
jgi:hypothetical protein